MNEIIVPALQNDTIPLFFKIISGIAFVIVLYYIREKKYTRFRKPESE